MQKTIVIFSMFTYTEYQNGISNTNSHVYNWLKSENPDQNIIFVDFNRYGFTNKLKYFIKYVILNKDKEIIKSTLFSKLIKKNKHCFVYKGCNLNSLFSYLNQLNNNIEIWSFNPFIKHYYVKWAKKYFYTIDDWRKNKIFKIHSEVLKSNYEKIPENFSKVFINNKSLKEKLYNNQNNIFFVPNGVDTLHYKNYQTTSDNIKKEIDNKIGFFKNKKIVGYMGVISDDRVNFDLCEYLISKNSELMFIFAGPILPGFAKEKLIEKYGNVKFIGMVYFQQLPYLFSKFDVCIIPHKLSDFVQSMDPKKLYEYLAAGKPIVTTPVSGTENFKDIISITNQKEIFSEYIQKAMNDNVMEKILKRQEIASKHDWQYRFAEIKQIISI